MRNTGAPRRRAAMDRLVGAWFARMRNVVVTVPRVTKEVHPLTPLAHRIPDVRPGFQFVTRWAGVSRVVKVCEICGANELGIWFDNETGSTFLRPWGVARADMAPARPVVRLA